MLNDGSDRTAVLNSIIRRHLKQLLIRGGRTMFVTRIRLRLACPSSEILRITIWKSRETRF